MTNVHLTHLAWNSQRPQALVVACSDGRLQEHLDDFLHLGLGISHYDRLYIPGGAGALTSSGVELIRPNQFCAECRFLLEAHALQHLYLIFHGPAANGPEEALCGDYRRKLPGASAAELRTQQEVDAATLKNHPWGAHVLAHTYRCEVRSDGRIQFVSL
jgi:hypothetical protein